MTKLSKTLDTLHTELAQTLLDKVRSGEAKASELNVARQFLKDNGIEGLPGSESLKDTLARVKPYWQDKILPSLLGNQNVLIVAHGNSLRSLIKIIDNINDQDIVSLNIPTGVPLVYEFNENLKPPSKYFLGDKKAIKKATEMIAQQGSIET